MVSLILKERNLLKPFNPAYSRCKFSGILSLVYGPYSIHWFIWFKNIPDFNIMSKNWFVELKNKTGIKAFTVLTFFTGFPSILKACAVCFSGTEETLGASYLTTLILIVLPIAMILSVIIWLYKKKQHLWTIQVNGFWVISSKNLCHYLNLSFWYFYFCFICLPWKQMNCCRLPWFSLIIQGLRYWWLINPTVG